MSVTVTSASIGPNIVTDGMGYNVNKNYNIFGL
jgi:hypothetical protein